MWTVFASHSHWITRYIWCEKIGCQYLTFNASICDFQKHFQYIETRFGAFEVGVRNANLTSFSSGALGVQQTDDVSGTSKEASVLTDGSFLRLDTLADTMTPVDRLLYHDHFVLPALRLKCLHRTQFRVICRTRHTCWQSNRSPIATESLRQYKFVFSLAGLEFKVALAFHVCFSWFISAIYTVIQ